ncbi:MAG: hypothetical protein RhofKO_31990 [Rhodothermales bacterium]
MSVLTDPICLGRDVCLAAVLDRVRQGRHVLLVGDTGIGKSRVIRDVYRIAQGARLPVAPEAAAACRRLTLDLPADRLTPLYIVQAVPLSALAESLMFALAARGRLALPATTGDGYQPSPAWTASAMLSRTDIRKLYRTARDRRHALLHSLDHVQPTPLILIDALDRASPTMAAFLLSLQQRAVLVAAVREVKPSQSLDTFFKTFGRVPVDKLSPAAMLALTRYLMRTYQVQVVDPDHYTRELIRRAEGNPAALRAMLHDGAQARLVTTQAVRALLERDDAPYFNMGILYVFALIGGTFLRTFMTGSWDTDWYILLSLTTIVGFVVFRVFRPFFTFYPAKVRA